jgi:DNA-binding CsgD family transcriptional regulator
MPLLHRDEEIEVLRLLFRDCVEGKGNVAVIRGPAGSGKTSLLRVFAEQAVASGALFLSAVASRTECGIPLGIVDQLLRSMDLLGVAAPQVAELMRARPLPGGPAMPEPAGMNRWLTGVFESLLKLLVELSEANSVVIAVDDLHHADAESLRCLSYLARRIAGARILLVLTACTQTLPADRLLWAEILCQGNCHSIMLYSLSMAGVASLLGEHLDHRSAQRLAPACYAMTGGNPLLVNALAEDSRMHTGGSEASLVAGNAFRSVVVACLHRYGPRLVEAAQAIALLGENAAPALLGELFDLSLESAVQVTDALEASGLLQDGQFRHEAARQAVLDHMTTDERAAMHAHAAQALYRTGASAAVLARHLIAARRIKAAWVAPVLRDAAQQALADGMPDRAIAYLKRAETAASDDRQRAAIRFARASAEWQVDPERAVLYLAELVADARAGWLDTESSGKLLYYLLWLGDTDRAGRVLAAVPGTRAEMAARAKGSQALEGDIWSVLHFSYPGLTGRGGDAGQDGEQSLPVIAPAGSEAAIIAAERILQEHGMNDNALSSVTAALMVMIGEDRLERAKRWCDVLRQELAGRGRSPLWEAVLAAFGAMIDLRCGNLPAADSQARTALALLSEKAWGVGIGQPLSCLLLTAVASHRYEDAVAHLQVPVPEAMFGTLYGLLYLHARGEYYLASGHPSAALADFRACGDRMATWGLDQLGLVPWRSKAAEAHVSMGDPDAAREIAREQVTGTDTPSSRTRGILLRTLALTSPPRKQVALLREAAQFFRDAGAQLELTYTLTGLSNAFRALGENDQADWTARQARSLAARCGAGTPAEIASESDSGEQESGDGHTKPLARLSGAERRVAMLAAYGYTNGQIAKRLYITVSTVEQHLTRVYRKLGVTSRTELPSELLMCGNFLDVSC